jgi:hypothetical protein
LSTGEGGSNPYGTQAFWDDISKNIALHGIHHIRILSKSSFFLMIKNTPRLFWPQKLGPYEIDLEKFMDVFRKANGREQQLSLISNSLRDQPSYPNTLESRFRYRAYLLVLADLLKQEWIPEFRQGRLFLSPPAWTLMSMTETENRDRKADLRRALTWERKAQFARTSVKEFIKRMEEERTYNDRIVSIRSLVADGQLLSKKLYEVLKISDETQQWEQISSIIQPYLQLITTRARCVFTGFYLQDIWRYFRYTWSTPYNSTPGRQMFYLVRDAAQPFHPIIGIAALGSSMVQLTVRDNVIGWTPKAWQERIDSDSFTDHQALHLTRVLHQTLDDALKDLAIDDLVTPNELLDPTPEVMQKLLNIERSSKENRLSLLKTQFEQSWTQVQESQLLLNREIDETCPSKDRAVNLPDLAQESLYRGKRANILHRLLQTQHSLAKASQNIESAEGLRSFWQTADGQQAIKTLLRENKKRRIGINMMDIIICGSVPPYNILLGGKLVAMLLASPQIVHDYQKKYAAHASTIASKMKGKEVRRDSKLVFLGTTSLYANGSSQYNRIAIPVKDQPNESVRYIRYGLTEGYGTVHFSRETVEALTELQEFIQGARLINNRFGEGVNPKLRRLRTGLSAIGLPSADGFLRHRSQRIVYGLALGRDSLEFLRGEVNRPKYYFKASSNIECKEASQYISHYWATRWLRSRIKSIRFLEDVKNFCPEEALLSAKEYSDKEHLSQQPMKL